MEERERVWGSNSDGIQQLQYITYYVPTLVYVYKWSIRRAIDAYLLLLSNDPSRWLIPRPVDRRAIRTSLSESKGPGGGYGGSQRLLAETVCKADMKGILVGYGLGRKVRNVDMGRRLLPTVIGSRDFSFPPTRFGSSLRGRAEDSGEV